MPFLVPAFDISGQVAVQDRHTQQKNSERNRRAFIKQQAHCKHCRVAYRHAQAVRVEPEYGRQNNKRYYQPPDRKNRGIRPAKLPNETLIALPPLSRRNGLNACPAVGAAITRANSRLSGLSIWEAIKTGTYP